MKPVHFFSAQTIFFFNYVIDLGTSVVRVVGKIPKVTH